MVVAAVVLRVATTRPLSDALLDLGEREQNVSVAESSTGGMISANLLSVADRPFFFNLGGSTVYRLASCRVYLGLAREKIKY